MPDLFYPHYQDGALDPQARRFLTAIAAAGLIWFSVKEGIEAMEKAKKR